MTTAVLKMDRRRSDNIFGYRFAMRFFIAMATITYLVITYWLFFPYIPVTCGEIKITNLNKQVKVGEMLWYEADMDKKMPIQAEVYHQLLNNFVIDYSPTSDTLPVGKRTLRYPLKIPNYAQPGTYKLKVEVHSKVNVIREVVSVFWSESFEIIN